MKDNQSRKFMSFQPHDNLILHKGEQTKDISNYEQQHYVSSLWYYWEPTGSCQGWLECNQWEANIEMNNRRLALVTLAPFRGWCSLGPTEPFQPSMWLHVIMLTCTSASHSPTLRFPQQNIPYSIDYLHCYESWQLSSGTKKVPVQTV